MTSTNRAVPRYVTSVEFLVKNTFQFKALKKYNSYLCLVNQTINWLGKWSWYSWQNGRFLKQTTWVYIKSTANFLLLLNAKYIEMVHHKI